MGQFVRRALAVMQGLETVSSTKQGDWMVTRVLLNSNILRNG